MNPLCPPRDDADSARLAARLVEALHLRVNAVQRDMDLIYAMAARPGSMQSVFRDARDALTAFVDNDGLERMEDGFDYAVKHLGDMQAERETAPSQGRLVTSVEAAP